MAEWQAPHGRARGEEWEPFATVRTGRASGVPVDRCRSSRRAGAGYDHASLARANHRAPDDREISTQMAFGKILDDLSADDSELAARIVTTSPDVTGNHVSAPGSTGASCLPGSSGRRVQGSQNIPSTAKWEFTPDGQHLELGIAEMNLFLLLGCGRAVAFAVRQAADPDRHRLRPLRRPRPRCAELCLLPGCAVHDRRHAVGRDAGAGRRRAPVHRLAADRDEPGRAGGVRTGLCRRAGRDHGMGLRLHAARWRRRSGRAHLVARRDRRLGLPAAHHQPDRATRQAGRRGFPAGRDRRRLLAAEPGPNCEVVIAYQGVVAPEAIGQPAASREHPARCRRAGRHLGGPAQRRLDRGTTRARPGQPSAGPYRDAD
jgi:pyruvate dehydrogenase E1 component